LCSSFKKTNFAKYKILEVFVFVMKKSSVKEILKAAPDNREVNVKGWVRTRRGNKNVIFIAVNDGSTIHNIQIVANPSDFDE